MDENRADAPRTADTRPDPPRSAGTRIGSRPDARPGPPRTACKLTVFFDDPFWVGLVEIEGPRSYKVAKHVFGAEPTDPEVMQFALADWRRLRFAASNPTAAAKQPDPKPGYKRMLRIAKKEQARCARPGTQAQQALQCEREKNALERKQLARQQKEAAADAAYEQRRQKRKAKHRGH